MKPVEPINAAPLFAGLHAELMTLLQSLAPDDWSKPTVAAGWAVKDMAAHLLDTDIRRLSLQRDRLAPIQPTQPIDTYRDLVDFLDGLNAEWIAAAKRISPRVLTSLLAATGPQLANFFVSLDPNAPGAVGVGWAGEQQSATWFDTARELTEKWMHQQQIRDAVGAPPLTDRAWLHPVLDTFVRGLPHTFRDLAAPDRTAVTLTIAGDAGDSWSLVRDVAQWHLYAGAADHPAATVTLDQDTAWRLFTKGLSPAEARGRATIAGDAALGQRVFDLVAIMA